MFTNGYTDEINVQILISLLKQNNIRTIVVSPGSTNVSFVHSIENDDFFNVYSAPDERSAGYIACGISSQKNIPVVLSCTGATASRNYFPALTEAYYRKLPLLVVTSSRESWMIGNHIEQVTDRTLLPRDIANYSTCLGIVKDNADYNHCVLECNKALIELSKSIPAPVHINLETRYSNNFSVFELPDARKISLYRLMDNLPDLQTQVDKKVIIHIENHKPFEINEILEIEKFCESYNSLVLASNISNYFGKYLINADLLGEQVVPIAEIMSPDLLIQIGNVGAVRYGINPREVWIINENGEVYDKYNRLTAVFEMSEYEFFSAYNRNCANQCSVDYYTKINSIQNGLKQKRSQILDEIPLSNVWVASYAIPLLPKNIILHLAILNSLRSWSYFNDLLNIHTFSNTGGFGIDGCTSTALGAALASPESNILLVTGDLAFYYDLNCLGNRHLPNNLKILLINNGIGTEFKLSFNNAFQLGERANCYIAASGHYQNNNSSTTEMIAAAFGLSYYFADSKESFKRILPEFLENSSEASILEVKTLDKDEQIAVDMIRSLNQQDRNLVEKIKAKLISGINRR